ncbi:MAG: diguanylate cyclase [Flexilinea sp.]|nr:diguanylate cyclase [Flexilinea sp.]
MERRNDKPNKKDSILIGIYRSSWGISMTTLTIVSVLEICMLIYTLLNPALYGEYISRYRMFYLSLLAVAIIYIFLYTFVQRDMEHRYKLLNIMNPIGALFFFVWSLGITWSDSTVSSMIDPTVYMTFSLTIPLSFFLSPAVYAAIVIISDALMIYLTVAVSGSLGPVINLVIFFIFQFVLGISFLRLKMKLAERIIEEKENARIDILTGLPNRRTYEEDLQKFESEPFQDEMIYIAIDINGLKEVNDTFGHDAGDKLIIGAAECIDRAFGFRGKMYRIGGDEFAVFFFGTKEDLEKIFPGYEESMRVWSERNSLELNTAYGYVCRSEFPGSSITEIAKIADERMYVSKSEYYQMTGKDRRSHPDSAD